MEAIKLGSKNGMMGCYPSPPEMDSGKMSYPYVHIDSKDEALEEIPKEGTITFRFKRRSTEERTGDDDETKYACCLDLIAITDVKKGGASDESEDREDALIRLKGEAESDED